MPTASTSIDLSQQQAPRPSVGDLVLIGNPRVTLPSDWFLARVLWIDGLDVLTEHTPPSTTEKQRDVRSVESIRAVGTIRELSDYKERCAEAVRTLSQNVHECEQVLGRARSAVWTKIDEINSSEGTPQ